MTLPTSHAVPCLPTNCVREFTEYSKPTRAELERDKPDLIQDIEECDPDMIGLVGGWAVEWVLNRQKAEMEKIHGVPIRVTELFGGELAGDWVVLPILHPAGAAHSPDSLPLILDDILTLGRLIDGEITAQEPDPYRDREDYRIVTGAAIDTFPPECLMVAIDTEGSASHPFSLQFSFASGSGYMIRAGDHAATAKFRDWLDATGRCRSIRHNFMYDAPVLRAMGVEIADCSVIDTMILSYLLNVAPQGLRLAYRHRGMEMSSYDEIIGDVGYEIAMEYLQQVAERDG